MKFWNVPPARVKLSVCRFSTGSDALATRVTGAALVKIPRASRSAASPGAVDRTVASGAVTSYVTVRVLERVFVFPARSGIWSAAMLATTSPSPPGVTWTA